MKYALWGAAAVALLLAWALGGRYLTLAADAIRVVQDRVVDAPAAVDGGSLRIGDKYFDPQPAAWIDGPESGPWILHAGAKTFRLQADDRLSLTVSRSGFGWPTPFEFNFMTGKSPSWKRYKYYRITCRKPGGATLDLLWRYQEWFYDDWGGDMTAGTQTGLISVTIEGS